jgi:hypothetical protein
MKLIAKIFIVISLLKINVAYSQMKNDAYLLDLKEAFKKFDASNLSNNELLYFKMKDETSFNTEQVKEIKENKIESEFWIKNNNLVMSNDIFDYYVFNKKVIYYTKKEAEGYLVDNSFELKTLNNFTNLIYVDSLNMAKIQTIENSKVLITYKFSRKDSLTENQLISSIHTILLDSKNKEILEIVLQNDNSENEISKKTYTFKDRTILKISNTSMKTQSVFHQNFENILEVLKNEKVHIINYTKD